MRYGHLGPIGILGISGGGATAIATLADDTSIKCGIIISTFSSLEEAARDELKRAIHFQSSFLLQRGLQVGAKNAGFNYTDINSVELAKKISQPVLVIHGENDGRFPLKMGRRIYDSLPSPGKEWFVAKHSDHDGILWRGDVVNMNRKILTFLAKQMDRK